MFIFMRMCDMLNKCACSALAMLLTPELHCRASTHPHTGSNRIRKHMFVRLKGKGDEHVGIPGLKMPGVMQSVLDEKAIGT